MNKKYREYLHPIFVRLPAENIVLLKCLLESYEGIAELRTMDASVAVVVILALEDTRENVENLLLDEQSSLLAEVIEKPRHLLQSDWLLSYLLEE
jgi:hypothetical protein